MDKAKIIQTGIGLTGIAIQLMILEPSNVEITNNIKKLEKQIDQTNQILKEDRQKNNIQFKDL